ncbi:uncharacterized protein LOC122155846 isoform X3 [Centrocercus urophasianus]|uniref:uncharacterized protein LOC122155846 isoform X3 n=1 Tax=Centrocercus urophasianus TaxID=9002 RepID=UPI001C646DE2|nr:uncharacterized protein LOC122155846 isoform X3 [Centrocercus urophasianus]
MLIRWILLCSLLVRLAQSNNQDSEKSANITTPSAKRNHKRTPSTPQRQESQVRSPSAFPSHAAGRTPATDVSSSLYCSMPSPPQLLPVNKIYDSVPHCNTQETASNSPHNDPSIPASLENQDVLIYASLNHSASTNKYQRRKLPIENEFIEYASIKNTFPFFPRKTFLLFRRTCECSPTTDRNSKHSLCHADGWVIALGIRLLNGGIKGNTASFPVLPLLRILLPA